MGTWIAELKQNIAAEFGHKPTVATLATMRSNATPDARSVVIRKLFEDGRILITSDARSKKNHQLKSNPAATIVLWLPKQKKQFRVDGKIKVLSESDPLRQQAWQDSSDSARALFLWPSSGDPRAVTADDRFAKSVTSDQPMPIDFEVLIFDPLHSDVLDLNSHPHLRRRFVRDENLWNESIVNP